MNAPPPSSSKPHGPLAAAALAVVAVVIVGVWLVRDRADSDRIDAGLTTYAAEPLPQPGAPVDTALASMGARIFKKRCAACHTITGESRIGPDLAGVTVQRGYAWMRHMMLAPDSMTVHDSVAAALKARYKVQMMLPGGVSPAQARAVIEFLRRVDAGLQG